ncbi:tetratricopeptide repeat-containing sensor histidine kinase [Flavobacterium sp. XS2P39]|uniref:tetratricopeptide repeat-containing sensor histidine kinase n=1 Tax=Flavobacterium sp. XS2P39 TaxID=3401725 RepID=UPI003AADA7B8
MLAFFLVLQSCEKKTRTNPKKQHNLAEINRLLEVAHKHNENQEFDSSYYYFSKAKYAAELKKDTSRIIHSLSWMAQIQRNQGDYFGSETTSIEAFPLIENSNKYLYGETNVYIGLGNNYLFTFDNDNAIYYFKKAINSKTDENIESAIKNNISMAYTEKGDYQKAIQILLPLVLKKELLKYPDTYARLNDNLGHTYDKAGNPKALYYLNQGLKIREQIKDYWGILSSYHNLSEYYKTRNPNLSNKYALLTYKKATKVKSVDTRLECLKSLIQNGPRNQSHKYSLLYLKINDSISKVRLKAKNQFAKIKYDFKKEKEENLKLKAQTIMHQQQQQNRNILLYFVVGITVLTSLFISHFLIAKNKREKIKASYTTEIRISKKLHDELANDVYHTMAFAETQDLSTSQNKEILLTNLDTIYARTRNISKENSIVETGPLFASNVKEMMSGFNTSTVNILTNGIDTINWIAIDDNKKITVYRVLQELLVNMKKHSQCSLVVLTFKKNENKLQIDYTDNGVGATFDELKLKNGLQNVENRIQAIKGTTTFDAKFQKGFKVSFIFPI